MFHPLSYSPLPTVKIGATILPLQLTATLLSRSSTHLIIRKPGPFLSSAASPLLPMLSRLPSISERGIWTTSTSATLPGAPPLLSSPPHPLSGAPVVRTARSAPRPSPVQLPGGGEAEAIHPSTAGAVPTPPSCPPIPPSSPGRRRWLPRWLYVGWCPVLLAVTSYALFAGGSLDFRLAEGMPRWLTPLLLALSFCAPTFWLTLTSSASWRALPAWIRVPGWLLAGWGYCTRFAYWPALLLKIAGFTGMEGGRLVDCLGSTPAGLLHYRPSWEASQAILLRWSTFHAGWLDIPADRIWRNKRSLISLYQTDGAAEMQSAVGGLLYFPFCAVGGAYNIFAAWLTDVSRAAMVGTVSYSVLSTLFELYCNVEIFLVSRRGGADRPPTDLSTLCSSEQYIQLSKWAALRLLPLLLAMLDPFQYGLPLDLLVERALQYLGAVLAEDNLFASDMWVEPPAYPEKPEVPPTPFKWSAPSTWWPHLSRWWKK